MAAKEVSFSPNPRQRASPEDLDRFVHGASQQPPPPEAPPAPAALRPPLVPEPPKVPMKRLTFDIPADLHLRMKLACVREGRDMAEVIRELIAGRFP
jgi:hypothetical protein